MRPLGGGPRGRISAYGSPLPGQAPADAPTVTGNMRIQAARVAARLIADGRPARIFVDCWQRYRRGDYSQKNLSRRWQQITVSDPLVDAAVDLALAWGARLRLPQGEAENVNNITSPAERHNG